MIYREFIHNRTYPLVMFYAVKADGTILADYTDDMKEKELGDMPVLAIIRQRIYMQSYKQEVPSEIVVLGEPLKNTDEEVVKYFKDIK
jgi:hypothetical protein